MKRLLIMIPLAALLLSGCGFLSRDNTNPSSSSQASSSAETSSSESNEVVTKTLVGDVQGVHHRDTITYQGKTMLNLHMELLTDLPQDVSEAAVNLSPEELTERIRNAVQQDAAYQEVQNIDGFSIDYSVTAEKKLQTLIDIDFQKITPDDLKKIYDNKQLGLEEIKDVTPEIFIVGMKLNGLKEETTP